MDTSYTLLIYKKIPQKIHIAYNQNIIICIFIYIYIKYY